MLPAILASSRLGELRLRSVGEGPTGLRINIDVKKLRLNKSVFAAALIALLLLGSSSCGVRESSLTRLVPVESCAIMTIDWSGVRANVELRRLMKGDEFENLLQHLRIKSESVKTVTVFSSIDSRASSGLLLRGLFDRKEITTDLKANGWREESLDGHKVYVNADAYVAMPSMNMLFAGPREGAAGVFRASEDPKESVVTSDSFKKINAVLTTKDQPLKAFLLIPQGTLDMADAALTATSFALSLFNLGGVGELLKAVNVAKGFGFSVGAGVHEKYPVELCVLMRDEESARFVSGSLNTMKTISELASSDVREQESLRAIRQMTIVRRHEVLAVRMEIPGSALFPPSDR